MPDAIECVLAAWECWCHERGLPPGKHPDEWSLFVLTVIDALSAVRQSHLLSESEPALTVYFGGSERLMP